MSFPHLRCWQNAGELLGLLHKSINSGETISLYLDCRSFIFTKSSDRLYYYGVSAVMVDQLQKSCFQELADEINTAWSEM